MKNVSIVGDSSNHGGVIITHNQDGKYKLAGGTVVANGALHQCPIPDHGITPISAVTTKSYVNGKLIVTSGAIAGCGAIITSPSRGHYAE